ncbi:MAG: glycerophosphodiester phosphodiesterase [Candidatus Rokuibacteriota bacterium]
MSGPTRVAAHRGGSLLWPENSPLAFRSALALGVDLLELDIHLTADGALAVVHDPTLDRTTDATGPVTARTAADLRRVRLRGPDGAVTEERVAMLEDVLTLIGPTRAGLLLEIKGPRPGVAVSWVRRDGAPRPVPGERYDGLEERAAGALRVAGLVERTTVMSFNPEVLTRMRALLPGLRTALLVLATHVETVAARPEDAIDWAVSAGATDVGLQHTLVDERVVAVARAAGVALGAWTANLEPGMRRLVALGVDVLTSDRPDLALAAARGR